MTQLKEYKCPACGGAMEFNSETQNLKCPFCDTEMDVAQFIEEEEKAKTEIHEDEHEEVKAQKEKDITFEKIHQEDWQEGETDNIKIYTCDSCGGEILAEDTSSAVICPYCGSKIIVKAQFEGDLKPDYVIPFKLDKKQAKEAYLEFLKDKVFLPKVFKRENHIDEIRGVYVPFWLYDVKTDARVRYQGEKLRVWITNDWEYTEHSIYEAVREGLIDFSHIPEDGSEKMDDTLMEAIEPFDFTAAVPFNGAYLAGYMADRYDVAPEQRTDRVRERVTTSAEELLRATVSGYDMVTTQSSNVVINQGKYSYALYPVWILNTTWQDKKYVFAMNGQTGKLVGDLPVDKGSFWKYVAIRTPIFGAIVFGLLSLLGVL